ncbi:MAG: hypothetical protein H6740_04570 [Alphaproteobacteria bacterium]|nr:hypothetical protein [Alphaproteobacteria bacterium]
MLTLLLLACTGTSVDPGDKTVDDSAVASDDSAIDSSAADDTAPAELHGELPSEAVSAPEFTALNHLGEARSRPDLIGHPTVMWFFPAAGTFG